MDITPYPLLALQLAIPFWLALAVLWKVLFEPYLGYLSERESASGHARSEASRLEHDAEHRAAELEKKLAVAREQVATSRAAARKRAGEHEGRIIHDARHVAEARVAEAVTQIEASRVSAAAEMRGTAEHVAREIVGRILGRSA